MRIWEQDRFVRGEAVKRLSFRKTRKEPTIVAGIPRVLFRELDKVMSRAAIWRHREPKRRSLTVASNTDRLCSSRLKAPRYGVEADRSGGEDIRCIKMLLTRDDLSITMNGTSFSLSEQHKGIDLLSRGAVANPRSREWQRAETRSGRISLTTVINRSEVSPSSPPSVRGQEWERTGVKLSSLGTQDGLVTH